MRGRWSARGQRARGAGSRPLAVLALVWLVACSAWFAGCRSQGPVRADAAGRAHSADTAVLLDASADAALQPDAAADAALEARAPSAIELENQLPGTDSIALQQPAGAEVAAYVSPSSVAAGEQVQLFVNVDHDQDVRWELYRIGYYQGHGARLVASGEPAHVAVQPDCPVSADTGLVECHWAAAFRPPMAADAVSGYYIFKLINAAGFDTYAPLIVRDAARRAPIVVQASVNTWQAYNLWGGTSLYKNQLHAHGYDGNRARQVSFDRPYDAQAHAFFQELPLVRWLERRGYDADYVTNLELDADPALLDQRTLFLTVFHDEYWTVGERDALDRARDAGVSLMFLSANTGYWRVRYDPASTGEPRRIITCYKSAELDPQANAPDTTAQFRQDPFPRPENALLGIMYGDWSDFRGFPFVVHDHKHWIYAGTSVTENEPLNAIIGLEWDSVVDNGFTPSGLEIVGDSPVISQVGVPFPHAQASVYYPTTHSFVFAAGSINWVAGLDGERADARVQRMAENLFARAGFRTLEPTQPAPAAPSDAQPARANVLAGGPEAGFADGPAASALFSSPSGVAAGPSGELFVSDTGNQLIRKLDGHGNVSTLAGCHLGAPPSQSVCFDTPTGIAVDAAGVVYVSDSGHNRIRSIAKDGSVSEFAGSGQAGAADSGDRLAASFNDPRGLAFGPAGELYVADFGSAAIRRIDASGVHTVANGLSEITGVAVDAAGQLYFAADSGILLGAIQADGKARGLSCQQARPLEGLLASDAGLVFADTGNYRIRQLALDSSQTLDTLLGGDDTGASALRLMLPRGIAAARGGYVVADSGNHRIVWFSTRP
jgi:DNA-binding beta-propeller fold protein YncE